MVMLVLMLGTVAAFSSCSKDDDDIEEEESTGTFSVSPLSVTLKKNSSTGATVKLIAPANWTSSFWGNAECSPTSGAKGT